MIITIDGTVASGKSTIARELADELGIFYLHTGLFYRAIAFAVAERTNHNLDAFTKLAEALNETELQTITDRLSYTVEDSRPYMALDGTDVTGELNDADLDKLASIISQHAPVRNHLLGLFRSIAEREKSLVADGRDCGSVIFPDADHKFFLTAEVGVRAERYISDQKRLAGGADLEKVILMIEERDERDFNRDVAPLKVPEGGVVIDNTSMTRDETVLKFIDEIQKERR